MVGSVMRLLRLILAAAQLALLLVPLEATRVGPETCPANPEEGYYKRSVIKAVCDFEPDSDAAATLMKEARISHGGSMSDTDYGYAYVLLFDTASWSDLECDSQCQGIGRQDVTWCVRLADVNNTIEMCVSVDDQQQPVYQSTCDAQFLNPEKHLSLPTVRLNSDLLPNVCTFLLI
jgi:hypothetical protein